MATGKTFDVALAPQELLTRNGIALNSSHRGVTAQLVIYLNSFG